MSMGMPYSWKKEWLSCIFVVTVGDFLILYPPSDFLSKVSKLHFDKEKYNVFQPCDASLTSYIRGHQILLDYIFHVPSGASPEMHCHVVYSIWRYLVTQNIRESLHFHGHGIQIMKYLVFGLCLKKDVTNHTVDHGQVLHKRSCFFDLFLVRCVWSWVSN